MSPVSAAYDICTKCHQDTLYREWWYGPEFREECSECGYFHEESYNHSNLSKKKLQAMHFSTNKVPYVREGFFRQPAGNGRHYIAELWYSVPTHGTHFVFETVEHPATGERKLRKKIFRPDLDIEWINDPKPRGPGYPERGRFL